MKTRRKIIKTPAKGRRSSIICVKKSPIVRRNPRRNVQNQKKNIKLMTYESPLKHLYHNNCLPVSSTSSNWIKKDIENDQNKKGNVKIKQQSVTDDNMSVNNKETSSAYACKRKISGDTLNSKKRKLKKSPLSKFNQTNESIKKSESIIIVDDSDLQTTPNFMSNKKITDTLIKSSVCSLNNSKSSVSRIENGPKDSHSLIAKSPEKKANDEVIVIDFNDTSLMEMEAYHDAINYSPSLPSLSSKLTDSVIVIDPDDEQPVGNVNTSPKINEDCFVVWSSLPKPSTSQDRPSDLQLNSRNMPFINYSSNLLKYDKISIDTIPDLSNLKLMNNENNKPNNKKITKSPIVSKKAFKKTSLKATLENAKGSVKAALKTTSKLTKATTKNTLNTANKNIKPGVSTLRKKAKNNGELIYLSESKESENSTKKSNSKKGKLREIVIDGSNVAMAYTNNKMFSEKGIKMLIDYFSKKGHTVKVFVPQYRRSRNFPLLEKWHTEGIVVFTPSRKLGNKSFTPYDDRYILEYATACDGIVVSQDQFRDLYAEKPQYRNTIENRLLVPTFVGDYVMFPEDPLGRDGPTLANFLKY